MHEIGTRKLTRSSRERMWAGVAGGLAEYFDLDPVVVRLMWVAATVLTGGLAIPAYIVLWIVMPRDDRARGAWTGPSPHLRSGVEAFSEELHGFAKGFGVTRPGEPTAAQDPSAPTTETAAPTGEAAAPQGATATEAPPSSTTWSTVSAPEDDPLFQPIVPPVPATDFGARRRRTAGVLLVGVGLLALAGQLGVFSWIQWKLAWPLILVAIGFALLMKQQSASRRW